MENTQFTIKLSEEESKIIKKAGELIGLGHTSFTRMAALKEARKVILDNNISLDNL